MAAAKRTTAVRQRANDVTKSIKSDMMVRGINRRRPNIYAAGLFGIM